MKYPTHYPQYLIQSLNDLTSAETLSLNNPEDIQKEATVRLKLMDVYSSINAAFIDEDITPAEADELREKYYWSKL